MSWTDERVAQLKAMWQKGFSASQIAKELGGTTRNAVIGKIHRLNLVARQSPKTTPPLNTVANQFKQKPISAIGSLAPITAKMPASAKASDYMAPATAFASLSPASSANYGSYDQTDFGGKQASLGANNPFKQARNQCQWPVGDPRSIGFHFCGAHASEGFSYCADHARMAYQPAQRKRISMGNTDVHATGMPDEREISVRY